MMDFIKDLLIRPYPSRNGPEVENLINELLQIGKTDDYLSERPGYGFDRNCHHRRAREIGSRLDQIGGHALMLYVGRRVKRKLGATLWEHLIYAWQGIGDWVH